MEGRTCPLHYRRTPEQLARPAERSVAALIVAGGLYGNPYALDAIEALARTDAALLCLNGDFHWFDAEPAWFSRIEGRLRNHLLTAGNVEAELADPSGVGCGCAYPETVPDAFVERSNRIIERLREAMTPVQRSALAALPFDARIDVGGLRVAVIHGDPESLAGWGLAVEEREADPRGFRRRVADWFRRADVDVIACAHTCLPHALRVEVDGRNRVVINNGAAGMANFDGDTRGLVTRIATAPARAALYRTRLDSVVVEVVPVAFDLDAWRSRFEATWPAGSAAALNYAARIVGGPALEPGRAIGEGFEPEKVGSK